MPRGKEAGGLVQRGGHQAAVDDPRRGLVVVAERDDSLVALDSLFGGLRQMQAPRVVAAPPARRVVVRRDPPVDYRRPPRSKWAR